MMAISGMAHLRDVRQTRPSRREFDAELQHRVRNLLGLVQSIASRTLGENDEVTAFKARVAALGRVQGMRASTEEKVDLGELIGREIQAQCRAHEQVAIEGESIDFPRAKAELLALAVHELIANARRDGALASQGDAPSLRWWTHGGGANRRLTLRWAESRNNSSREIGGHRDFGRELLERALPHALGATTEHKIGSAGVHCQIEIPLPE
jgi:two-component system, chemotaxis family, CheB/CheR fusion protein